MQRAGQGGRQVSGARAAFLCMQSERRCAGSVEVEQAGDKQCGRIQRVEGQEPWLAVGDDHNDVERRQECNPTYSIGRVGSAAVARGDRMDAGGAEQPDQAALYSTVDTVVFWRGETQSMMIVLDCSVLGGCK